MCLSTALGFLPDVMRARLPLPLPPSHIFSSNVVVCLALVALSKELKYNRVPCTYHVPYRAEGILCSIVVLPYILLIKNKLAGRVACGMWR